MASSAARPRGNATTPRRPPPPPPPPPARRAARNPPDGFRPRLPARHHRHHVERPATTAARRRALDFHRDATTTGTPPPPPAARYRAAAPPDGFQTMPRPPARWHGVERPRHHGTPRHRAALDATTTAARWPRSSRPSAPLDATTGRRRPLWPGLPRVRAAWPPRGRLWPRRRGAGGRNGESGGRNPHRQLGIAHSAPQRGRRGPTRFPLVEIPGRPESRFVPVLVLFNNRGGTWKQSTPPGAARRGRERGRNAPPWPPLCLPGIDKDAARMTGFACP